MVERPSEEKKRRKPYQGVVNWWNSLTYTTRMTMAFALIAAMTAMVAIGVLSFVWQQHFHTYTQENMESLAESTATRIEEVYSTSHTLHDPQVEAVAKYAESLNSGVGVAVIDNTTGKAVYDSSAVTIADGTGTSEANRARACRRARTAGAPWRRRSAPASSSPARPSSTAARPWGPCASGCTEAKPCSRRPMSNSPTTLIRPWCSQRCWPSCWRRASASCSRARWCVPSTPWAQTARAIKEGDLSARTGIRGEDEIARLGMTFDEMADSIERDRKLERRLTTDVAHELRTPLMAIQATVEAMVDGVFDADEERLETVNGEVKRLSRLSTPS